MVYMEKRIRRLEHELDAMDHARLNINVRPGTALFNSLNYMVDERKIKAFL